MSNALGSSFGYIGKDAVEFFVLSCSIFLMGFYRLISIEVLATSNIRVVQRSEGNLQEPGGSMP